jgi:hypothetical protein
VNIAGAVYSESAIDFKGNINGYLNAQKIILNTKSSTYLNTLLDASIGIVDKSLSFPSVVMESKKRENFLISNLIN